MTPVVSRIFSLRRSRGRQLRRGGQSPTPLSLRQQDRVLLGVLSKKLNLLVDFLLKAGIGCQHWILMAVFHLAFLPFQFTCEWKKINRWNIQIIKREKNALVINKTLAINETFVTLHQLTLLFLESFKFLFQFLQTMFPIFLRSLQFVNFFLSWRRNWWNYPWGNLGDQLLITMNIYSFNCSFNLFLI